MHGPEARSTGQATQLRMCPWLGAGWTPCSEGVSLVRERLHMEVLQKQPMPPAPGTLALPGQQLPAPQCSGAPSGSRAWPEASPATGPFAAGARQGLGSW